MNSSQKLNVVFGTGPLGLSVAGELAAQGKPVRLVNRSGQAHAPEGAQVFKADANDAAQARQACEGAAVVYHCAMPPYTDWPRSFPPLTNSILAAAAEAGARLVYGDNLYAYGPVSGAMTEDMPLNATTRKGKVRAQMERTLIEAHPKPSPRPMCHVATYSLRRQCAHRRHSPPASAPRPCDRYVLPRARASIRPATCDV